MFVNFLWLAILIGVVCVIAGIVFANLAISPDGAYAGMGLVAIGAALLVLALLFGSVKAFAQHPAEHQDIHQKFYSTWTMPDAPQTSCCSNQDCSPVASRFVNNRWEAQHNGLWFPIPPNKIEQNRDSPDGRSHLCGRPGPIGEFSVFCFVRGGGA